jgi:hypothetical protein
MPGFDVQRGIEFRKGRKRRSIVAARLLPMDTSEPSVKTLGYLLSWAKPTSVRGSRDEQPLGVWWRVSDAQRKGGGNGVLNLSSATVPEA